MGLQTLGVFREAALAEKMQLRGTHPQQFEAGAQRTINGGKLGLEELSVGSPHKGFYRLARLKSRSSMATESA
jgi:hypothetical protein